MKLTVAMGLQYDNGKQSQLYALMLGQGGKKAEPTRNSLKVASLVTDLALANLSGPNAASFILTYNPEGLPVQFMLDSSSINLFA